MITYSNVRINKAFAICRNIILTKCTANSIWEYVNCSTIAYPFLMKQKLFYLLVFLLGGATVYAQKPLTEGTIKYKVVFENASHQSFSGTYVFTFKNGNIRKELMLSNGFRDIVIINTNNNAIYSLHDKNGKRFAIQLSMEEMKARQTRYIGFKIADQQGKEREFGKTRGQKATVTYKDGRQTDIYYTGEWYAEKSITYERFPEARFLPLYYTYADEVRGFSMSMEATDVSAAPVENSLFRVPGDYKIITNEEYKLLSRD